MFRHAGLAALTSLLVLMGIGCVDKTTLEPTSGLGETPIPAGFTFANTRPVEVRVQTAPTALQSGEVGGLVVSRADGRVLFRGVVRGGQPLDLRLPVPLAQGTLRAALSSRTSTQQSEFPISAAGSAALRFE